MADNQAKPASSNDNTPDTTKCQTRLLEDSMMVSNVEFSRHAAPKPMIARYRQMPHGRLEFLVGPERREGVPICTKKFLPTLQVEQRAFSALKTTYNFQTLRIQPQHE